MNKHGWTYKKLGEVCEVERGGSPRPIQQYITDSEDGVNWIKIGDAQEGSKYITSTKEKIIPEGVKKSRLVHCGDFILSNSMSFGRPYILKVDGCIHDGWLVIRDKHETFMKDYLYYYLSSPTLYRTFTSLAVGGVVNNLNSKLVRNVDVIIPPKEEQLAIVAELDEINETIELLKQQVADLDKLEQSTFNYMFGDPITNEKGWEVQPLKESVHEMFLGPFGSSLKVSCYVPKEEAFAMVYEQKHAIQATLDLDNHFIDKQKFDSLARFEVKPNDFIMSCRGTIGKIFQLPNNAPKGIIHPSLMKIRINNDVYDNKFFVFVLQRIIAEQTTKGNCVQMAITAKELGKMDFILPPLILQQEFAAKVEVIETAKAEINAQIAEMQNLLASRMDYYFD